MDHTICPGSKALRSPKPESVACPSCGTEVEIWTDELRATCKSCNRTVLREGGMSCLEWCKMGKECVGTDIFDKYMTNRAIMLNDKLIRELENFFGSDKKRIEHAKKVLGYAEELLKKEEGDWHIVVPASILHDVGIKPAEEKYGSASGELQEKEGPPVARKILLNLGLRKTDIDEICEIIGHHHSPGKIDTQNFRILYDADCLVNIQDFTPNKAPEEIRSLIDKMFLTKAGKEMAIGLYGKG